MSKRRSAPGDPMVLNLPDGYLKVATFKERASSKEFMVCVKIELPSPPFPPNHSIQFDLDMATWRKIIASVEKQRGDIERGEYTTFKEAGF